MKNNVNLISLSSPLESIYDNIEEAEVSEVLKILTMKKKISEIKNKYKSKIKKRGDDGRYYIRIDGKQINGKTESEIYQKIYEKENAVENYTIFELFPMYIKYKQEITATKNLTLRKNENDFKKYFDPYHDILNKPFISLSVNDFKKLFIRWTGKREMTSKNFNNLKSIINGIYSYVITELDFDCCNQVKKIEMRQFPMKPVKKKDKSFTTEERKTILDYLRTNHENNPYYLAIAFNFYVGMRLGELLAIRNSDINNGCISVNGQINKDIDLETNEVTYIDSDFVKGYTEQGYRNIPLNQDALDFLEKARELNPNGEYVFMFEGKPLNPDTYNSRLRRLCIKLGLEPRSSHSLRFTFASILYYNGISIYNISKLLGHTDITMTQRYINDIMPSEELYNSVRAAL